MNKEEDKNLNTWEKLCVIGNQMEAEILKSYLESCGIEVMLRKEAAGKVYGLTAEPLAEVEFWVLEHQMANARELMEAFNDGKDNPH